MKQDEIKACAQCGKGVMHTGLPLFWTVTIRRYGVDLNAVRRAVGLEMFMGSPQLAAVMGPDEDIAKPIGDCVSLLLCESCAVESYPIAALAESVV